MAETSLVKRVFLPLVATLNVPPYSMLLWMGFYVWLCWWTPRSSLWIRTLLAVYGLYCVLDTSDSQALQQPAWIQKWQNTLGRLWFIRWTAEYFPTQLIVPSTPLDPQQSYIFCYHPHGVIGMGANLGISTNGSNFDKHFPGIRRSVVTLNCVFWVPFFRHWLLALGCISANKETVKGRLQHKESVILVPGGAAEALHAHPKTMTLCIRRRKGFVRLARETGAKLVPVLGFGENDIFETLYPYTDDEYSDDKERLETKGAKAESKEQASGKRGTQAVSKSKKATPTSSNVFSAFIWRIQQYLYKKMTFSIPLWFHWFPKKRTLVVVVGEPIALPKESDSTLDECHQLYCEALATLYNQYKDQFGYQNVPLIFV